MNHPDRPDYTATKIATQGLTLEWIRVGSQKKSPPLIEWKKGSKRIPGRVPRSLMTSESQIAKLTPFLEIWKEQDIATCVIHEIPDRVFVSRLFTVPKDKTDVRPIIDLSEMNTYVNTPRTKMEHLEDTTRLLQEPSWAAKVDIKDAFWSVLIATFFRRYFCFWVNGTMWMFLRMPFGLTTAPWVFTRLMRVIKKFLRKRGVLVNSFIDDFIVWASTRAQVLVHLDWTKRVLMWLGFKINVKKTSESPVQSLVYLGVQLDLKSLTLSLPLEKIAKLKGLCNATLSKQQVSRVDLEGLIGLITFSYSVIPIGRMFATPLIVWMNKHTSATVRFAKTSVTASLRELLEPFCKGNFLSQKVSFKTLVPDLVPWSL